MPAGCVVCTGSTRRSPSCATRSPSSTRPESPATPVAADALAIVLDTIGGTLVSTGGPEEALEPVRRGPAIRRSLVADADAPNELL
ncbi:hypothetical protein [Streptomyces phaeoluteigriseus]|uniref:hypothetical protein n=1 Tax=Streptomyces phaeoluteigriseus TaxID=114686 RepID=UPI0011809E97|nr:hypothetical protein [Streptomyces phaeoluteigriseus]